MIAVVVLAVVAAAMYAVSDFLEQRAASRAAHLPAPEGARAGGSRFVRAARSAQRTLRRLITDRQWALGWSVGTLAYFVQAGALHLGSVSVVQSLQVTTLLFALPLSTVGSTLRPRLSDWLGGGLVCGALALLLLVREHAPHTGSVHRGRILFLLVLVLATVVLLAALAVLSSGATRAVLLAVAAGAAFASSASLVKLTTEDLASRGVAHTALDWPGYTLAVVTGLGMVLQQLAFAAGRLPTATTAMVVSNPVIGSMIAVIGFAEPLPSSPGLLTGLAGAGVMLIVGVALLAHSPLLRGDAADQAARRLRTAQITPAVPNPSSAAR
jgi:drug/metabolite transporter (DMT)-like permease